jgi:hypothetical protein
MIPMFPIRDRLALPVGSFAQGLFPGKRPGLFPPPLISQAVPMKKGGMVKHKVKHMGKKHSKK